MTNKTATATLHTNRGDVVIDLFGNRAPVNVDNFGGLATGERVIVRARSTTELSSTASLTAI